MSTQQGSSLLALVELGTRLGYQLICTTTFNALFVRKDLMNLLPQPLTTVPGTGTGGEGEGHVVDYSLTALHDSTMITDIFQTYDGELKLCGPKKLIWHKVAINLQNIQPLKKKKLRQFPFAPKASSQTSVHTSVPAAGAGAAGPGREGTSEVTSSLTLCLGNDDPYPCLLRLEESLEVLIDKHQLITSQCEVQGDQFRKDFLLWWTPELSQVFLEKCSQLIDVASGIIGGVPFESSSSPLYEISIDALLWCLLILCHTSHQLLSSWSSPSPPLIPLPEEITHFLSFALQSVHSISSLYQSIGNFYSSPPNGNGSHLTLASKYFQHSISFFCLFHCCALAPFLTHFPSSLGPLSHDLHLAIASISSRMNSKIKINKKNQSLFNFSQPKESSSGGAQESEDSRKLWQVIFEKSYWIWLGHLSKPMASREHPEISSVSAGGLEFYSLVTNNLGEQLLNRIQDARPLMPPCSSSCASKVLRNPDNGDGRREGQGQGEEDEEGTELLEIISRACGRLNLRKKYRESLHQSREVRELERQVKRYQRIVAVLVGVTCCVSLGCSLLIGRSSGWRPSPSSLWR
jgi:hypothetical protein